MTNLFDWQETESRSKKLADKQLFIESFGKNNPDVITQADELFGRQLAAVKPDLMSEALREFTQT